MTDTNQIILLSILLSIFFSICTSLAVVYFLETADVVETIELSRSAGSNTAEVGVPVEELVLDSSTVDEMIVEYERLLEDESLFPDTIQFYQSEIARLQTQVNR